MPWVFIFGALFTVGAFKLASSKSFWIFVVACLLIGGATSIVHDSLMSIGVISTPIPEANRGTASYSVKILSMDRKSYYDSHDYASSIRVTINNDSVGYYHNVQMFCNIAWNNGLYSRPVAFSVGDDYLYHGITKTSVQASEDVYANGSKDGVIEECFFGDNRNKIIEMAEISCKRNRSERNCLF